MKYLLVALMLFAQPAFAGDDDRYRYRDRDDRREYEYEYRDRDRGKYHCHYERRHEYCHRHKNYRKEHTQEERCVWVQYKNIGVWTCEQTIRERDRH